MNAFGLPTASATAGRAKDWARSAVLYHSTVVHTRRVPWVYRLRHQTYLWLVDIDDLPQPPWYLRPLAGFKSRDHSGDSAKSLRTNIDEFASQKGVDVSGDRILMLAHARVFGYVFNPLSVFWCLNAENEVTCVVAEVHNTYGGRHRYLLHTDEDGKAQVPKAFYVSPFHPVDGEYHMSFPLPDRRLRVAVQLNRPDGSAFTAGLSGRRQPVSTCALLAAALKKPFSTLAVSTSIRWHGIRLYLRGLPVIGRPSPASKEGSR